MAVHSEEPQRKPKVYRPVSETRKVRKPLMERKRRERINSSLEQLALLLKEAKLVAADKPVAKLEKADILELTVRHLKSVRRNANIVSTPPQEATNITKCSIKTEIENSPNIKKTDLATNGNLITDEIPNPLKPIQTCTKVSDDAATALSGETSEKTGKEARDSSYIEGFHMCLSEVKQAAESAQKLGALKDRIFDHLETCLLNLPPETTSNERIGNEKRARSQENDCETKARRKKKKLGHHEESDLPQKSCSEAVTEVTLVPMQLSDGRVAFLMQGDAKILITEKNNDRQDPQNPTYSPIKIEQPILNKSRRAIEACPNLLHANENKAPGLLSDKSSAPQCTEGQKVLEQNISTPTITMFNHNDKSSFQKKSSFICSKPALAQHERRLGMNLLKIYPNIKTVSLPIGPLPNTSSTSNVINNAPRRGTRSANVVLSSPCSEFCGLNQNAAATALLSKQSSSNSTFTLPIQSQTLPFTSETTSHYSSSTTHIHPRTCIVQPGSRLAPVEPKPTFGTVYSGSHLAPVEAKASVRIVQPNAVTVPLTSVSAPVMSTLMTVPLIPTVVYSSSDTRVNSPPQAGSLANQNFQNSLPYASTEERIVGSSLPTLPPTPPPSVDQYLTEPLAKTNPLSSIPVETKSSNNSASAFVPQVTLEPSIMTSNWNSTKEMIPCVYTYFQYLTPARLQYTGPTAPSMSFAQQEDEEFIDVENVPKEDHAPQLPLTIKGNSQNFLSQEHENGEMWRPW